MPAEPARPIATISAAPARARPTGVSELDRVLGGGLVPGAVVLLAGEPGVGKSTLLLDVAQQWAARAGTPSLVVSGEESVSQVRLRAERIGALHERLYLAAESDLSAVLGHLDAVKPGLLVLDSVQTISAPGTEGVPGGVTQVRAVTAALVAVAKERGIATVLVGHVTKDGQVAGPRVLEHLVDVVLHFEGDKHSSLRLVRGVKNRFGAADEVGCFEMHEGGIASLADPSGLFLTRYAEAGAGHLRDGGDGGPPGAGHRGAGADRRRGAGLAPAHRVRASTAPGWPWCWPCCRRRTKQLSCTTARCSRPPSAASGSPSRPPTWRWRSRSRPAGSTWPWPRPGGDRRGRPDRRGPPGRRGPPPAGRGGPARLPLRAGAARLRPGQDRRAAPRACGSTRSATCRSALQWAARPRPSDAASGVTHRVTGSSRTEHSSHHALVDAG